MSIGYGKFISYIFTIFVLTFILLYAIIKIVKGVVLLLSEVVNYGKIQDDN